MPTWLLKAIKGATLPSARICLARTPHALQYSLATRIEVEAHGEVLVIIDGDFGLCLGRLDCRAHAAPAMSLQLTWSACNYLARSPGKRIAEFAARVTQRVTSSAGSKFVFFLVCETRK